MDASTPMKYADGTEIKYAPDADIIRMAKMSDDDPKDSNKIVYAPYWPVMKPQGMTEEEADKWYEAIGIDKSKLKPLKMPERFDKDGYCLY